MALAQSVSTMRYTFLALAFSLLWASGFPAIKIALRDCPPLLLMTSRFLVAGVVLLAAARLRGAAFPAGGVAWRPVIVLGLLNNAVYLGVTSILLVHISAGMGAVLASTNPLILALVAPRALGERLTRRQSLGMVVSYAGVAWVMWSRIGDGDDPRAMAVWLVCIGALVAGTILFKRWEPTLDLVVVNGGQALAGAAWLAPAALVLESVGDVRPTPALLAAQAWLTIAVTIAAMLLWLWLLRHGDATRASAWWFLNPVLGVALGALVLGEPARVRDFLGAAVVGAGIWMVQRAAGPRPPTARLG